MTDAFEQLSYDRPRQHSEYSQLSINSAHLWTWHAFVHGYPMKLALALTSTLQEVLYSRVASSSGLLPSDLARRWIERDVEGTAAFLQWVQDTQSNELREVVLQHLRTSNLLKQWVRQVPLSAPSLGVKPPRNEPYHQPHARPPNFFYLPRYDHDGRYRTPTSHHGEPTTSAATRGFQIAQPHFHYSHAHRPVAQTSQGFIQPPYPLGAGQRPADPQRPHFVRPAPDKPPMSGSTPPRRNDVTMNYCIRCGLHLANVKVDQGAFARHQQDHLRTHVSPSDVPPARNLSSSAPLAPAHVRPAAFSPLPPSASTVPPSANDHPFPSSAPMRHARFASSSNNSFISARQPPSQSSSFPSHHAPSEPSLEPDAIHRINVPDTEPPRYSATEPSFPDLASFSEGNVLEQKGSPPSWTATLPRSATTLASKELRRIADPIVDDSKFAALLIKDAQGITSVRVWKDEDDDLAHYVMALLEDSRYRGAEVTVDPAVENDPVSDEAVKWLEAHDGNLRTEGEEREQTRRMPKRVSVHLRPGAKLFRPKKPDRSSASLNGG